MEQAEEVARIIVEAGGRASYTERMLAEYILWLTKGRVV